MKYICDKARECKAIDFWCKTPFETKHKESFTWKACDNHNVNPIYWQVKAIPCEEIEYNNKSFELCPHGMRTPDGYTNITLDGCYCGNMGKEENCKYCYGHDKENKKIYCTYKHFNPEVKMEYKIKKIATMVNMEEKRPCRDDFRGACQEWLDMDYRLNDPIDLGDLILVAEKYNGIQWLIDHGFIEKVEEEFYSRGDRFEESTGWKYILCEVTHHKMMLFNVKTGCRWNEKMLNVRLVKKIPASDFHARFGDNFKKIKE
jgi:hypothetical protein